MGVSVSIDFFLEEIEIARNSLSKLAEFLTKYCNVKQNSTQAWIPFDSVDAVTKESYRLEDYEILPLQVGYDRYSAQYLIQDMNQYGFHMDDVYQGENLTPVIHECDGLIRDRTLALGDNSLLKAHFLNVGMKQNTETRKIRPVKIDQRCHIDGFVAVMDALTVRQKWYDQIGEQLKNNE